MLLERGQDYLKILIFGTGKFYQNRKEQLWAEFGQDEVIGFLDNHRTGILDGRQIYRPEDGIRLPHDKIVIMSVFADEMLEQLLSLDVPRERITTYSELYARKMSGVLKLYMREGSRAGKRILIISEMLDYNGGAMAAVYAAESLRAKGYDVCLAVPKIHEKLLQEVQEEGLNVIFCPTLPFVFEVERYWIASFDIVLVNVFPMMVSALEISRFRPVLWWIHESADRYTRHYSNTRKRYPKHAELPGVQKVRVLAVSQVAADAFEQFYPQRIEGIMPYGIPDDCQFGEDDVMHPIGMAILGNVSYLKAQKEFLEAVSMLPEIQRKRCRFYVVGLLDEASDYGKAVIELAGTCPEVSLTGVLTRKELQMKYSEFDVIVSPSYVDSLPIAVTEGLMNEKICIVSDATGHAHGIIRDGENGFICRAGDVTSLAEKMAQVIKHFDELGLMREKARKTYEKYFSMEAFGERLERELLLTEREYWAKEGKR